MFIKKIKFVFYALKFKCSSLTEKFILSHSVSISQNFLSMKCCAFGVNIHRLTLFYNTNIVFLKLRKNNLNSIFTFQKMNRK